MAEYYTMISKRQISVLCALGVQGKIQITQNMLNYLYSLERQGKMFMRDSASEEFRKAIKEYVGRAVKNRTAADEKEYAQISQGIRKAFQILCASHTSRYLAEVEKELRENEEK